MMKNKKKVFPSVVTDDPCQLIKNDVLEQYNKLYRRKSSINPHSFNGWKISQLAVYKLIAENYKQPLIIGGFTHCAIPIYLEDLKEIHDLIVNKYQYSKEVLSSKIRTVYDLQPQSFFNTYGIAIKKRKLNTIPYAYYDIAFLNKANFNIELFVMNTSGDRSYTQEMNDKVTSILKNKYSIPTPFEIEDNKIETNLKKWDLVDCYDRSKWYPATIMDIKEEGEIEGIKFFNYQIGWRLYPEHYNNLEDPEDKPEKHLDLWTTNKDIETDSKGEKFFGDRENFDEKIPYFSKRIQKFDTFSKLQLKYLNYNFMDPSAMYGYHSFSSDTDKSNPLKIMSDNLYNDTELIMDQFYKYEKDGKKNIILGKTKKFSCYFALLLKKIEEENGFEKLMEILQDKPNAEEIYTIFFILYHSFNYIHIDYFKEKMPILKKVILEFINDLDAKKMKTMPKDFRSVVIDLLEKISKNENADFFYEVTLSLSLKEIKTSTFNLRLNGIKDLDEFIEKNKNNKEMRTKIIELIKKNELIQEIFGANYHSQIINKSKEIVKLLLLENQLNKDDIELIWNCTKKGDLEAKVTILKLLYELADNLKEDYDDRYCYMNTFLGYFNKTRVENKCLNRENFDYFCNAIIKILELNTNEDIDYSLCDLIVILSSTFYTTDNSKKSKKKYINEVIRACPIFQKQGFWIGLTRFELNQEIQQQKKEKETLDENSISLDKINNSITAKLMSVTYNILQFVSDSLTFNKIVKDIFNFCKIDDENRNLIMAMMESQLSSGENGPEIVLDKDFLLDKKIIDDIFM